MDHSLDMLPPLDALRAFEAAARNGSFSGAAEQLNVTHGAVSRQVAKLERWIGFKLFDRVARGVILTIEGNRLFVRTKEAFSLIADNTDRWTEPRGTAVVRLTSIPSVTGLWLIPRLHELERATPSLRIVLSVDPRQSDLGQEGIDLSVRCGRGSIAGRVSLQLFEEFCYPIAAPDIASAVGTDGDVQRLLKYSLIHDSDASGWRAWLAAHGVDYHPRPQDRRFEDYNLVLDAAANGLGIALARPPLAEQQVKSGRLAVSDYRTVRNPVSYWMDRPEGAMRPAAQDLAQRIATQAGVSTSRLQAFLRNTGSVGAAGSAIFLQAETG